MKKTVIFFAFIICSSILFGQIEVNPQEFENVKNGKTYFVVTNKDLPSVKPYWDVLKQYWTLTPIEIINEKDMGQYIVEGNSFFKFHQIGTRENDMNVMHTSAVLIPFGQPPRIDLKSNVFLDFFYFDKTFIEKYHEKERPYMFRDFYEIARIAISLPSFQMIVSDKDFFLLDNLSSNWQPGYFKNYLQYIQNGIKNNNRKKMYVQAADHKLSVLKSDTLLLPHNIEDDMSDKDVTAGKKLFADYSHPYRLINTKELSDKILNSQTPVYYLLFVHFMPDKFIEIINSVTGEIIYANLSSSRYVKPADFKELDTEINKTK